MIKKQFKNKLMTLLFLSTLSVNLFGGMALKDPVRVYAATPYDGVYESLLSMPISYTGSSKTVDRAYYNDSSQFASTYTYTAQDYFGIIPYSSSNWVAKDTGVIASKTYTTTRTNNTATSKKSIVPNGDFKVRQDGTDNQGSMPAQWTFNGTGSVYRGTASGYHYNSIAVNAGDSAASYLDSDLIPVVAGSQYTIEQNWSQGSGVSNAVTELRFFNSSGSYLSNSYIFNTSSTGKVGISTKVRGVFTVPAGTTQMVLRLVNWGRGSGGTDYKAWWQDISIVPGNLFSEYDSLFSSTINVTDGVYSGTISKTPGTITWTENHGATNRKTPVINLTGSNYTTNLFNAAAGIASTKAISFYDPSSNTTINGNANLVTGTATYTGTRTYYQLNGPDGKAGYGTASALPMGGTPDGVNMGSGHWTTPAKSVYRGYENAGNFTDAANNVVITRYAVANKTSYGGASVFPQLAWYSSNSTSYDTAATGNIEYLYGSPPRLNNDTAYLGYGASFDGLKNVVRYNGVYYKVTAYLSGNLATLQRPDGTTLNVDADNIRYPFIPTGGGRTSADSNTKNYLSTDASVFDYGWVMTYNGWSTNTNIAGVRAIGDDPEYVVNQDGSYRKFANITYTRTQTKEVRGSYRGQLALPDIAPGGVAATQTYSGTINQTGTVNYTATPSYTGTAYQRIKGRLDKPAAIPTYTKYDNIYLYDLQTYDSNVTRLRVQVMNDSGAVVGGLDNYTSALYSESGNHKRWNVQTINLAETIPDTPAGQNYYVRVTSYNGTTALKTLNLPFRLATTFVIDQPTISSKFLYIGEQYTIDVSGPRNTENIEIFFPFAVIAPNGTEITANSWVTIPRSQLPYDSATNKRSGSYTFTVSETQPAVDQLFDMEVRGRSITDAYTDSKYINDVYLRIVRILGLEMKTKRWSPSSVLTVNQKAPVATPIQVKAGYLNTIQIEHRRASRLEVEFFVGNTAINDMQFFTTSGTMVRYNGVMTSSVFPVLAGDNGLDNKITIDVNNPNFNFVDIGFIIPQVFRDANIGNVLSIKIKAYDQYGYIINNTLGDSFLIISGSEKQDREDPNNIR